MSVAGCFLFFQARLIHWANAAACIKRNNIHPDLLLTASHTFCPEAFRSRRFWCLFTHKNTAFCSKRIAINFERSQAIFRWELKGSGAASCFSCIMSRFPLSLAGAEVYRSRWKKAVRRRAPDRRQVELKKRPAAPQPVRRLINHAGKQSQPRRTVDRP